MSENKNELRFYNYSIIQGGAESVDISTDDVTFTHERMIYVGGSGDLKVTVFNGGTVTYKSVPVGFFPVLVTKVFKTGTTATEMISHL